MTAPNGCARRYAPVAGPPRVPEVRVLVIDNYDSFTFNLVQYLLELGATVDVVRNDEVTVEEVFAGDATHLVLSPGPGRPEDSGVCQAICRHLAAPEAAARPLLGVCLGHQTLCAVLGAEVVHAERIMHGKTSAIRHDGEGIFHGLPTPFLATRYHSLLVEPATLPASLVAVAHTAEGELMGVRHRERPLYGVQFHPESILSEHGHAMLDNFLRRGAEAP